VQVVGPARAPEIKLSSDPEMPADEVLSQLLLGRSIADLSPAQIAEIAVGLAQLTGKGGGFDPLGRIRAGLGLDRLSVGSNADGKGQVEAGRNLAPGVYLGVKQSTAGAGTQATVEIDIGRGMKLWGEVGTSAGGTSATGAAGGGGSGVGISWSKEY
jgi:translocation and assembly module TamB